MGRRQLAAGRTDELPELEPPDFFALPAPLLVEPSLLEDPLSPPLVELLSLFDELLLSLSEDVEEVLAGEPELA